MDLNIIWKVVFQMLPPFHLKFIKQDCICWCANSLPCHLRGRDATFCSILWNRPPASPSCSGISPPSSTLIFAVRTQQCCLKPTLMMAKDQRWEVIVGGSLQDDHCNQCDALLCRCTGASENPKVREKD